MCGGNPQAASTASQTCGVRAGGRDAERREVKVVFLDLVNKFDTADRYRGMSEALKAEHGSHSLFDTTVVLFNDVV